MLISRLRSLRSFCQLPRSNKMNILVVPCMSDNYSYIILHANSDSAIVVDPTEYAPVKAALDQHEKKISAVFAHHHSDHVGGIKELVENCSVNQVKPKVYGGDSRIPELDVKLEHNSDAKFGEITIKALSTPGHTTGSMCYYVQDTNSGETAVFTGDTMFAGGCGRLFEGTAEQMYNSLVKIIGQLPKSTPVYCGHEYTKKNLSFAKTVDPGNKTLIEKVEKIASQNCTVPSLLSEEFETNPFLRSHVENVVKTVGFTSSANPIDVLSKLRAMKDKF